MNTPVFRFMLMKYMMLMWIPFILLFTLLSINRILGYDVLSHFKGTIFGLPIVATNGTPNLVGFAGFGIISVGGLAMGVIALGGGAIGVIAIGGGAVGVVAMGGGAVGIIALGGGAAGLISIGGGAAGYYVLAGDGWGKHVLSGRRQDRQAVRLFCRCLPGIKKALAGDELRELENP